MARLGTSRVKAECIDPQDASLSPELQSKRSPAKTRKPEGHRKSPKDSCSFDYQAEGITLEDQTRRRTNKSLVDAKSTEKKQDKDIDKRTRRGRDLFGDKNQKASNKKHSDQSKRRREKNNRNKESYKDNSPIGVTNEERRRRYKACKERKEKDKSDSSQEPARRSVSSQNQDERDKRALRSLKCITSPTRNTSGNCTTCPNANTSPQRQSGKNDYTRTPTTALHKCSAGDRRTTEMKRRELFRNRMRENEAAKVDRRLPTRSATAPSSLLKSILHPARSGKGLKQTSSLRVKFDENPIFFLIPVLTYKEKTDLFVSKKEIKMNKIMDLNRRKREEEEAKQ